METTTGAGASIGLRSLSCLFVVKVKEVQKQKGVSVEFLGRSKELKKVVSHSFLDLVLMELMLHQLMLWVAV